VSIPKRRTRKDYTDMTKAELAEATKEFDEEFVSSKTRPLTAKDKRLHARAKRRGRPQIGEGAEKIRVSIERGLLVKSDAYAHKHGMSRSELIAKGLRAVIAARSA
jgi:hypothetical protein